MLDSIPPVVLTGDCRAILGIFADNSIDAIITDPPYELGFMGKGWDASGIAYSGEVWAECLRVLKPGGHLLSFGGTRTYHRMACAVEDAGFEIRDSITWLYGSGFPKSLDVSKAIDKAAGAEREVVGSKRVSPKGISGAEGRSAVGAGAYGGEVRDVDITAPATPDAQRWQGWGTALKPAHEPIVVARKTLGEKTVAANVLAHGTGALNIDACRIEGVKPQVTQRINTNASSGDPNEGRWPANVALDDDAAAELGEPARFFYCAKAPQSERPRLDDGTAHPTVKPLALMSWLVKLVTPPGGIVLDPFAGSGTTLQAARDAGFIAIGIEADPKHVELINRRLAADQ